MSYELPCLEFERLSIDLEEIIDAKSQSQILTSTISNDNHIADENQQDPLILPLEVNGRSEEEKKETFTENRAIEKGSQSSDQVVRSIILKRDILTVKEVKEKETRVLFGQVAAATDIPETNIRRWAIVGPGWQRKKDNS